MDRRPGLVSRPLHTITGRGSASRDPRTPQEASDEICGFCKPSEVICKTVGVTPETREPWRGALQKAPPAADSALP